MNIQALRIAAQKNGLALQTKSTSTKTAVEQLNKWGSSGTGAVRRR